MLRWAQRGAHLRGNSGPVESFRSAAEPIPAAATREARCSPGDLAFSKPSRAPHRAQFYGAGVQQGAQKVRRPPPRSRSFAGRGVPERSCSYVAGFSRWPPNWNRIADRSLFW